LSVHRLSRLARPGLLAFVIAAPAALAAAAAVYAAGGRWWPTLVCALLGWFAGALVPRERSLRRLSSGQGIWYGQLRDIAAANVPQGQTRLLRRYGDQRFYTVGRRQGRAGTQWVVIQRFDEEDLPDPDSLLGTWARGALVCTAFVLHPWYPLVSRRLDGITVTIDGQHMTPDPAARPVAARILHAHRLGLRTGLERAEPDELREITEALAHADIVEGGPAPAR
jgi:hypothetical protein